ncbi:MAG: Trk system potassium transporter TrkA [Lentisphaerae bacterium]|nr:Trk system potassium transporter TrkA [Lentisphaerota bacterium]
MNIIILGAGEIGYHTALSLSRENRAVILVESDPARADQIDEDENDIQVVRGNAADPEVLLRAGLENAHLLLAVTNSDETNITACMFAARLAPEIRRVARIRQIDTRMYGHLLTDDPPLVHAVVHPEELCARKILDVIRCPATTDVNWFFKGQVVLVSLPVKADSPANGWNLVAVGRERAERGLPFLIAMLVHDGVAGVPAATDVLKTGNTLYLATPADRLSEVLTLFVSQPRLKPMRNVTIFGGGRIGLYLAEMLDKHDIDVKIIEPDERRAARLADQLPSVLVLCGEPSDPDIFDEEKIANSDAFVAVTGDQEDNLIAVLYAKSFGIRLGVAALHRGHLAPLVQRMGIDTVVMPQQVAVGKFLEHVRAGNIASVIVFEQYGMEVIEALVPAGSRIIGRPLSEVRMPRGTLVLALQRAGGETIIPDGRVTVLAGDRIAVISPQRHITKVEDMLGGG